MNTILAITYTFLLSFCPLDNYGLGDGRDNHTNATHVQFELGLDIFDTVRVYTGEETFQVKANNLFNWSPYIQSYFIGAEYHKDFNEKFCLSAGVYHKCQHPISCWGEQESVFNSVRTEIYVNASGKLDIF